MRKGIERTGVTQKERKAILEFKKAVNRLSPEAEFILFGSKARGDDNAVSDIDILVLVDRKLEPGLEEEIFGEAFDVGLNCDTTFGVIVYSQKHWDSSLAKEMPLHWNIDREGIFV